MKRRPIYVLGTISLIAIFALSGCASTDAPGPNSDASVATSTPAVTASPTTTSSLTTPPPSAPASDIDASVQVFVSALNELGIEHTDPVRAAVGGSGAKATFDLTVNGHDSGINVFSDNETLVAWGKASDSFGGIYVAQGNAVLSLNSTEGVADSAEIAPRIAAAVGGEAHGV